MVIRGVSEDAAHIGVAAPQWVAHHLAASKVVHLESQQAVAVIGLKQCGVGVCSKVLKKSMFTLVKVSIPQDDIFKVTRPFTFNTYTKPL